MFQGLYDGSAQNFGLPEIDIKNAIAFKGDRATILRETMGKDLNFSFWRIAENFYEFYESFIYRRCDRCNKKQKLALCLLCGECVCVRSCEIDTEEDNLDFSKIEEVLILSRQCMLPFIQDAQRYFGIHCVG